MVTKLNAAGTQVLFTAVVDDPTGNGLSRAHDLKINQNGEAIVAGDSWLGNFTTTSGAYQTTSNGDYEVFTYKVAADFSALVFSTLLGGSGKDELRSMCCDNAGNIYLVGRTESSNFPIAGVPLQAALGGGSDGFIAVLSPNGATLLRSTYLGGPGNDELAGCTFDTAGNLCVVGTGVGAAFPTTSGVFRPSNPGGASAWVGCINSQGTLLRGTYFGSSSDETGWRIAACFSGVVIAGRATTGTLPTTPGSYDPIGGGMLDGYVVRMTQNLTTVVWATYLGGSQDDEIFDLCVDNECTVYVGGHTNSSDFPTTPNGYDLTFGGPSESFLARISPNGTTLDYSTFLGGSNAEATGSITCCPNGSVCITGTTLSPNYPVQSGGVQTTYQGGYSDIFLTCIFFCPGPAPSVTNLGPGCNIPGDPVLTVSTPALGSAVTIQMTSTFPNAHYWIFYSYGSPTPFFDTPSGCTVYVDVLNVANFFQAFEGFSNANGTTSDTLQLPYEVAAAGLVVTVQGRMWAPGGPLIFGDWLSNGIRATLGCP